MIEDHLRVGKRIVENEIKKQEEEDEELVRYKKECGFFEISVVLQPCSRSFTICLLYTSPSPRDS